MFEFTNQENDEIIQQKKLSPSQRGKNLEGKVEFGEKKLIKSKHEEVNTEKEGLTEKKVLKKDSEAQTETEDNLEKITSASQTEVIKVTSIGVNTDEEEIKTLESI